MSSREGVSDGVETNRDGQLPADLEWSRPLMAVSMGEIEDSAGDQERRAIRMHIAQTDSHERLRAVCCEC
jgi:hypothetical protein